MEVILLEDVADLGKKYDTVEVADGYGMNYLLPEGKARAATDRAKSQIKAKKEQLEEKRTQEKAAQEEAMKDVDAKEVTVARNANENDQLFAGIDAEEVAEIVTEELDVTISAEVIELDSPIKALGEYAISLQAGQKEATLTLRVESES